MDDPFKEGQGEGCRDLRCGGRPFDDEPLGFWDRVGKRTIANLKLHSGAKVLDVGCGTGASALPAAHAVGKNGSVVGIDLATRLLDRARAKALAAGLDNVEFRLADMTALNYPDESFDAVVSVFSIFFVPDMESMVRELWRMVRPGGKLAVTTWGPRIFEPAYSRWLTAVGKERSDLANAFDPWDRITDVVSVRKLLHDGGVKDAEVIAEELFQPLRSPDDWWTIALGSGLRWTIDQMGPETAARVRADNVGWLKEKGVDRVETNAIYAIGTKRS